MGEQMFVYISVSMWRANENSSPCSDLDKILHEHPHLSKEGLGAGLNPPPFGTGWHETLTAEGHIFENCLQTNKRCSAGCK